MSKTRYQSESRKNPPDHTVAQIATTILEGQQESPLLSHSVAQIVTKTPKEQQKSPLPSHSVAQAVTKILGLQTIIVKNNIPI